MVLQYVQEHGRITRGEAADLCLLPLEPLVPLHHLMVDLLAPRRSAHASIRGYLYQALLGAERWLRLGTEGEAADAILCEGDEDLDGLIRDGIISSEQIKDYSGPIGIGDRVVRETLARFLVSWTTLRDRGETRHFVFTTTAPRRPPRSGPDILHLWHDPAHREEVIQGIREQTQSLEDDATAVETALAWLDEHSAWDDFLASVDWHFEAPHFAGTRTNIARHLADRAVAPQLHETLIDRLLAHVLETSTSPEPTDRILTEHDFTELLELTEQELARLANWCQSSDPASVLLLHARQSSPRSNPSSTASRPASSSSTTVKHGRPWFAMSSTASLASTKLVARRSASPSSPAPPAPGGSRSSARIRRSKTSSLPRRPQSRSPL